MLRKALKALRFFSFFTCVFTFSANAVFGSLAESNIWAERRKNSSQETSSTQSQFASLSPAQNHFSAISSHPTQISQLVAKSNFSQFLKLPNTPPQYFQILSSLVGPFGTVRELILPPGKLSKKVVIHIQDIHNNLEAQTNISSAIQKLFDEKLVNVVALEGASRPIKLEILQNYKNRESITAVANYFLKENKISGPVHSGLLTSRSNITFLGVDDATHHKKNIEAFQESAADEKHVNNLILKRDRELTSRKNSDLNKNLLKFDRAVSDYRNNRSTLLSYIQNTTQDLRNIPPHTSRFLHAARFEPNLQFDRIERERTHLIQKLTAQCAPDELKTLFDMSAQFRIGNVSAIDFYSALNKLCLTKNINLKKYPAMDEYLQYILAAGSIKTENLFSEIKALEDSRYDALIRSEKERILINESRLLYLTQKLIRFSLTREEWADYKESQTQNETFLKPFESFYLEAEKRDEAIAKNTLDCISSNNASALVLVTGGFHAPGIKKHLINSGVAVISFVPRLTKIEDENGSAYLSVFSQEKTPLQKLFEGEKLFLAQDPLPGHIQSLGFPSHTLLFEAAGGQTGPKTSWQTLGGDPRFTFEIKNGGGQMATGTLTGRHNNRLKISMKRNAKTIAEVKIIAGAFAEEGLRFIFQEFIFHALLGMNPWISNVIYASLFATVLHSNIVFNRHQKESGLLMLQRAFLFVFSLGLGSVPQFLTGPHGIFQAYLFMGFLHALYNLWISSSPPASFSKLNLNPLPLAAMGWNQNADNNRPSHWNPAWTPPTDDDVIEAEKTLTHLQEYDYARKGHLFLQRFQRLDDPTQTKAHRILRAIYYMDPDAAAIITMSFNIGHHGPWSEILTHFIGEPENPQSEFLILSDIYNRGLSIFINRDKEAAEINFHGKPCRIFLNPESIGGVISYIESDQDRRRLLGSIDRKYLPAFVELMLEYLLGDLNRGDDPDRRIFPLYIERIHALIDSIPKTDMSLIRSHLKPAGSKYLEEHLPQLPAVINRGSILFENASPNRPHWDINWALPTPDELAHVEILLDRLSKIGSGHIGTAFSNEVTDEENKFFEKKYRMLRAVYFNHPDLAGAILTSFGVSHHGVWAGVMNLFAKITKGQDETKMLCSMIERGIAAHKKRLLDNQELSYKEKVFPARYQEQGIGGVFGSIDEGEEDPVVGKRIFAEINDAHLPALIDGMVAYTLEDRGIHEDTILRIYKIIRSLPKDRLAKVTRGCRPEIRDHLTKYGHLERIPLPTLPPVDKPTPRVYGKGTGTLVIIRDERLSISDLRNIPSGSILAIPYLATSDVRVGPFSGILTFRQEGEASHAQARARLWGIPHALMPGPDSIEKWEGKLVTLEVTEQNVSITHADEPAEGGSQKSTPRLWRQGNVTLPPANLEPKEIFILGSNPLIRDPAAVGYKAANLNRLGPSLPDLNDPGVTVDIEPGMVIPFRGFEDTLIENGLMKDYQRTINSFSDRMAHNDPFWAMGIALGDLRELVEEQIHIFPETLKANLDQHLINNGLLRKTGVFARVSTNAEDLPDFPGFGAGIYATVGNVKGPAALWRAIKTGWASLWTENAFWERASFGIISNQNIHAAIWLVPSKDSDYSFVIHTTQAGSSDPNLMVIELVQGLGESLVGDDPMYAGMPTKIVWDKKNKVVLQASIGTKQRKLVLAEGGGTLVEPTLSANEFLTLSDAHRLTRALSTIGIHAEQFFDGTPQDIEGVIKRNANGTWAITLLQSRTVQKPKEKENPPSITSPPAGLMPFLPWAKWFQKSQWNMKHAQLWHAAFGGFFEEVAIRFFMQEVIFSVLFDIFCLPLSPWISITLYAFLFATVLHRQIITTNGDTKTGRQTKNRIILFLMAFILGFAGMQIPADPSALNFLPYVWLGMGHAWYNLFAILLDIGFPLGIMKPIAKRTLINPVDIHFVKQHQHRLEELENERYGFILRARFIEGKTITEIGNAIGHGTHSAMTHMLRVALKELRALVASGRPSMKKLVHDNNAKLDDLVGVLYANALRQYYIDKKQQKEIAGSEGVGVAAITFRIKKGKEALLKALNLFGPSDEELVETNFHLLDHLGEKGLLGRILKMRFMDKMGPTEIGKQLKMQDFNVRWKIRAGLKELRQMAASPDNHERIFVRTHQHLLVRLDEPYRTVISDHFLRDYSLTKIARKIKTSTSQVSQSKEAGLKRLHEFAYIELVQSRISLTLQKAAAVGLDISLIPQKAIDRVILSDITLQVEASSEKPWQAAQRSKIFDILMEGHTEALEAGPVSASNEVADHVAKNYSGRQRWKTVRFSLADLSAWKTLIDKYKRNKKGIPVRAISIAISLDNFWEIEQQLTNTVYPTLRAIGEYETKKKIKIAKHLVLKFDIRKMRANLTDNDFVRLIEILQALNVRGIWLQETSGLITPADVQSISRKTIKTVQQKSKSRKLSFGWRFKENGYGLINILAALEEGFVWFDTALGGVGNSVATEDAAMLFWGLGAPKKTSTEIFTRGTRQVEDFSDRNLMANSALWGLHRLPEKKILADIALHIEKQKEKWKLFYNYLRTVQKRTAPGNSIDPDFESITPLPGLGLLQKISNDETSLESINLAMIRLGDITAGFAKINSTKGLRIIAEDTAPLDDFIIRLMKKGKKDEAERLLQDYFSLTSRIFERGLLNWNNKISDFGVNSEGRVVLVNFGTLEEAKKYLSKSGLPLNNFCSQLGFTEGSDAELIDLTKQFKTIFGFEKGTDALLKLSTHSKAPRAVRSTWVLPLPEPSFYNSAALNWINLIAGAAGLVALTVFFNQSLTPQAAGTLAAIYFSSFLAHEFAHWAEMGFAWSQRPQILEGGLFSGGIGVPGSHGWPGTFTSALISIFSLVFIPIMPQHGHILISLALVNGVFGLSPQDLKDIYRRFAIDSSDWVYEIIWAPLKELWAVYLPSFNDTHALNKNRAELRRNQQIILASTVLAFIGAWLYSISFITHTFDFSYMSVSISSLLLSFLFAHFLINPLTHSFVNAYRLLTGSHSTSSSPKKGRAQTINPVEKAFVLAHQDKISDIGHPAYETLLRRRYIDGWPNGRIADDLGYKGGSTIPLRPMIKRALEALNDVVKLGRPSFKKLVVTHQKKLKELVGDEFAHILRLRYLKDLTYPILKKRLKNSEATAILTLRNAEMALLKSLGLYGPSDEELVKNNLPLLKYIDPDPIYAEILKLRFLNGSITTYAIGKRLGHEDSGIIRMIETALKRLRHRVMTGQPSDLEIVKKNVHLLPQLTPRYRDILKMYFLEGKTRKEIAENLGKSSPMVIGHARNSAMNELNALIFFEQLKRDMDQFITEAVRHGVDFEKLTPEVAERVRLSDSTLRHATSNPDLKQSPQTLVELMDNLLLARIHEIEAGEVTGIDDEGKRAATARIISHANENFGSPKIRNNIFYEIEGSDDFKTLLSAVNDQKQMNIRSFAIAWNPDIPNSLDRIKSVLKTMKEYERQHSGVTIQKQVIIDIDALGFNENALFFNIESLKRIGIRKVWLRDANGVLTPDQVEKISRRLVRQLQKSESLEHMTFGWMFHDAKKGLIKMLLAMQSGIFLFDTSLAGQTDNSGSMATEEALTLLLALGSERKSRSKLVLFGARKLETFLNRDLMKDSPIWGLHRLSQKRILEAQTHLRERIAEWRVLAKQLRENNISKASKPTPISDADFTYWTMPNYGFVQMALNDEVAAGSVPLAENRLDGLTPSFVFRKEEGHGEILMERTTPLLESIQSNHSTGNSEEVTRLLDKYFSVTQEILKRGLINWNNRLSHFGVTSNGKVVLVNIGQLEDGRSYLRQNRTSFENYSNQLGFSASDDEDLYKLSEKIKKRFKLNEGNTIRALLKESNGKFYFQKRGWSLFEASPPLHSSESALSWINLLSAFGLLIAISATTLLETLHVPSLSPIYYGFVFIASAAAHELAHWAQVGFKWENHPRVLKGFWNGGIGVPGSRGWPGMSTSAVLAIIASFFVFLEPFPSASLTPYFYPIVLFNLVFSLSLADLKDFHERFSGKMSEKNKLRSLANLLVTMAALTVHSPTTNAADVINQALSQSSLNLNVISEVLIAPDQVSLSNNWSELMKKQEFPNILKKEIEAHLMKHPSLDKTQKLMDALYQMGLSPTQLEDIRYDIVIPYYGDESLKALSILAHKTPRASSLTILVEKDSDRKEIENHFQSLPQKMEIRKTGRPLVRDNKFILNRLEENLPIHLKGKIGNVLLALPNGLEIDSRELNSNSPIAQIKILALNELLQNMPVLSVTDQLFKQLMAHLLAGKQA